MHFLLLNIIVWKPQHTKINRLQLLFSCYKSWKIIILLKLEYAVPIFLKKGNHQESHDSEMITVYPLEFSKLCINIIHLYIYNKLYNKYF